MTGQRRILLDLSLLATPTTARGVGRYAKELARGLHRWASDDPEWSVLAIAKLPLMGPPAVTEDIPALLGDLEARQHNTARASWASRVRLGLGRAVQVSEADLVHSLDPEATPLTSLSCPRVVTCHHVESTTLPQVWHGVRATVARSDRRRFSRADRIIAISRATAQELITRLNVARDKIAVVHNGTDLTRWKSQPAADDAERRRALGVGQRPYLLCVGSVNARKNVDGVLTGLAKARRLIGSRDLELCWAAKLDRSEVNELADKAMKAGVTDAVHQVGYVPDADLAALYRGATALVFASKREGFGYPVVEAMACGCPVITSNCSSLIEVAERAAVTVDPDDTEAIADAIVLLADGNAERRRLSKAGVHRAAHFSVDRMVEKTLAAYEVALLGPRGKMPSQVV